MRLWGGRRCWGCITPAKRLSRSSETSPPPRYTGGLSLASGLTTLHSAPPPPREYPLSLCHCPHWWHLPPAGISPQPRRPTPGSRPPWRRPAPGLRPPPRLAGPPPQFPADLEVELPRPLADPIPAICPRLWFLRKYKIHIIHSVLFVPWVSQLTRQNNNHGPATFKLFGIHNFRNLLKT